MDKRALLDAYLATEMHFESADGAKYFTSTSLPTENTAGTNELAELLGAEAQIFWVITAFNPVSQQVSPDENFESNEKLRMDLLSAGFEIRQVICGDPHSDWAEASFLVWANSSATPSAPREFITSMALKYKQNAFFEYEANQQRVIPGVDSVFSGMRRYSIFVSTKA